MPLTALTFHPGGTKLATACVNKSVLVWELASGSLTDWSKLYSEQLPSELSSLRGALQGINYMPDVSQDLLLVWSTEWFYRIDMQQVCCALCAL